MSFNATREALEISVGAASGLLEYEPPESQSLMQFLTDDADKTPHGWDLGKQGFT